MNLLVPTPHQFLRGTDVRLPLDRPIRMMTINEGFEDYEGFPNGATPCHDPAPERPAHALSRSAGLIGWTRRVFQLSFVWSTLIFPERGFNATSGSIYQNARHTSRRPQRAT